MSNHEVAGVRKPMHNKTAVSSFRLLASLAGALVFLTTVATIAGERRPRDPLEQAFLTPSSSARPWVYWMWMDGNLSREGITADLEAMQRAGIGGVIIMEVNVGVPRGPVKFMSAEWRKLFAHVIGEAKRLGLQVTLNAGPGWTGSGGPWVKPEQSMQHLVASTTQLTGPTHFDALLPQPKPRPAFFGDGALPPGLEQAKNAFYRDVTVLAFPSLEAEESIPDIEEKALYVRAPYSSQPGVKAVLPAPAEYPVTRKGAAIDSKQVVDLTTRLQPDGRLVWDAPPGQWTILRFGRTSTGANTRPAPVPGLGLECDKLDPKALDAHFNEFVGALLREVGSPHTKSGAGWTSLHIDSWEMGAQNWTAALREEFRRRRGYDPLRYLPALTGRVVDSREVSERFLWDLRQTVHQLILKNHALHLKELGRRQGLGLSIEPYDMTPCADMSLGSLADVPMCEFWLYGFDTAYSVFEAVSTGHTCGRPIIAAEAFTSTDAERWQAYPGTMKALGDWAFCSGVNRFVFHRYQHQPWLDRLPGMTMGPYGVHWERTQTWWEMVPAYHAYLSRCQQMLRRGLPVADVCYLVGEGAPHVFRPPRSALGGNPPDRLGYTFDGCAPETLLERMSVKNGRLTLPDGVAYRMLVLPEEETITPALLRKVRDLVATGAVVVGPRPRKSPSLSDYPACDRLVNQIAEELWGNCDGQTVTRHRLGKGSVVWDRLAKPSETEDERTLLKTAKWIWFPEGSPAVQAPVGRRYFRRRLNLERNPAISAARIALTADNAFVLWVNGRKASEGNNFNEVYSADLASLLRPGTNLIAVEVENGGDGPNPAGLIASLQLRFEGGRSLEIHTDGSWEAAHLVTPGWTTNQGTSESGWATAFEIGPFPIAPWNLAKAKAQLPDQYGDFLLVTRELARMGVPPDFESDAKLRYTHRCDRGTDIYFVANPEERGSSGKCTFRVSGKRPELWDPVSMEMRDLPDFRVQDSRTVVTLDFEPHQSFFVVFRKPSTQDPATSPNFPKPKLITQLTGPWDVSFDPKWGGPGQVTFGELQDWTLRNEAGIRFYSGKAVYRKEFTLAKRPEEASTRIFLDLGEVKNLARVRLNGNNLGVVWCSPWRVDLTQALAPGENRLEIEVVNLWPNRLIGDEQFPPDCEYGSGGELVRWPDWLLTGKPRPVADRLTFSTWKLFSKDSALLPSGLIGPVRLISVDSSLR